MPNLQSTQNTQSGSSQNALKRGFHSIALLAGEDEQDVLAMHQDICAEYEVTSALDRFLVSQLVQNMLIQRRIHNYKQSVVNAALYSAEAKQEFKEAAQLPTLPSMSLPDAFLEHDPKLIQRGESVVYAIVEAKKLLESINSANAVALFSSASAHSPNLLYEIHELGLKNRSDALRFLSARFCKQTINDNLNSLINELKTNYSVHINWYQNESKYRAIIDSLKAKASLALMQDANLVRYETTCLNKILKIRQELQQKKDLKALDAKAIEVTAQVMKERSKGAAGKTNETAQQSSVNRGSGNAVDSSNVTDVTEVLGSTSK